MAHFATARLGVKIFLSIDELNDAQRRTIQDIVGDAGIIERIDYGDDAPMEAGFTDCDVAFGNVPPKWLEQTPALNWIQLESVGFGEYRALDRITNEQQITLTNLAGLFSDAVAETALAGILSLYRGIDQLVDLRTRRHWIGDPLRAKLRTLTASEVVLIGYGAINRRLAELLSGFACRLSRFGSGWSAALLDEALRQADIVVCAAPETDQTLGIFDPDRLARLKSDAIFVNCGRGSIVDERALADALNSRRLGGAVIDVTCDEPLPNRHPFWQTPNTILTQHTGGGTTSEIDRKIAVFADNLERYLSGQPLRNVVNLQRGY